MGEFSTLKCYLNSGVWGYKLSLGKLYAVHIQHTQRYISEISIKIMKLGIGYNVYHIPI